MYSLLWVCLYLFFHKLIVTSLLGCYQCEGIVILIPYHLMKSLQLDQLLGTGTLVFQEFTLTWLKLYCHNEDLLDFVVTTTHIECGWGLELFLFLCFRVFRPSITFFVVDGLVVWPEGLLLSILACGIFIITFFIIDGLVGWLSFLIVKAVIFLLIILNPRPKGRCHQLHLSIFSHHPC